MVMVVAAVEKKEVVAIAVVVEEEVVEVVVVEEVVEDVVEEVSFSCLQDRGAVGGRGAEEQTILPPYTGAARQVIK